MALDQTESAKGTPPCFLEQARLAAGRGGFQEALALLERAASPTESNRGEALRLRGLVRLRLGQVKEAVEDLEGATAALGDHAPCLREFGVARLRLGVFDGALEALQRCLRLDPDDAQAHAATAGALLRLGRAGEALKSISSAISLEPHDAGHLHNRAVISTTLGRHREATHDYEQVLSREPQSAGTMNNLAWLLAVAPDPALRDGPRAVDLARRAVARGRTGAWLDTLAAAQAACGDFELAIRTEREALELSSPPNAAFKERLDLYRQGRCWTLTKSFDRQRVKLPAVHDPQGAS